MTTTTRVLRCGEAALLLECSDLAAAVALAGRVEQLRPDVVDVVAAARTVLVTARDSAALPDLRRRLEALLAAPGRPPQDPLPSGRIRYPYGSSGSGAGVANSEAGAAHSETGEGAATAGRGAVVIDVRYHGPDLADVARLADMSVEALVRRHTEITWRAAFGGFAPGFAYLVDARDLDHAGASGPARLPQVPRLPTPRPRVPAGSVALADRFCAVYPGTSPGGWRLIGTTDAPLWDLDRPRPALLAPGTTVLFRDAAHPGDPR